MQHLLHQRKRFLCNPCTFTHNCATVVVATFMYIASLPFSTLCPDSFSHTPASGPFDFETVPNGSTQSGEVTRDPVVGEIVEMLPCANPRVGRYRFVGVKAKPPWVVLG